MPSHGNDLSTYSSTGKDKGVFSLASRTACREAARQQKGLPPYFPFRRLPAKLEGMHARHASHEGRTHPTQGGARPSSAIDHPQVLTAWSVPTKADSTPLTPVASRRPTARLGGVGYIPSFSCAVPRPCQKCLVFAGPPQLGGLGGQDSREAGEGPGPQGTDFHLGSSGRLVRVGRDRCNPAGTRSRPGPAIGPSTRLYVMSLRLSGHSERGLARDPTDPTGRRHETFGHGNGEANTHQKGSSRRPGTFSRQRCESRARWGVAHRGYR